MSRPRQILILGCLLLSGLSGLAYEILWTRWFGLVFGTMAVSVSAVLAAFFLGLAAGGHLAGRLARRLRRPFLAYAALEAAIGVFAAGSPALIESLSRLEAALGALEPTPLLAIRFVAALLVLFVPTCAMGATLPIILHGLTRRDADAPRWTARVYGVNTLGAVLGAYATSYWLLPWLGGQATLALIVALNLAIAAVAAIGFRDRVEPADASRDDDAGIGHAGTPAFSAAIPLALAAFAGFVSIALEVVLTRLLGVILEGTIYSFGAVLATFLAGIGLGSLLVGRHIDRYAADPRRGLGLYAWLMLIVFAGVVVPLALLSWGHYGLLALERSIADGVWRMHAKLTLCVAVLLPLAVAFGAAFPLLVALYRAVRRATPAEGLGRLYAINTVGAVAGSAAAGLVLVPELGTDATVLLILALVTVQAVLAAAAARRWHAAAAAVAVWATFAVAWPGARLSGLMRSHGADDFAAFVLQARTAEARTLFFAEGRTGTVAVYRGDRGSWSLVINGLPQAGGFPTPPPYGAESVILALLPYAIHPAPASALVVGYGGGVTTDILARTEEVERVRVVEIEPRVLQAVETVHPPDRAPHHHPKVEVVVGDGRNVLLRDPERFDLILNHVTDPWLSGAAGLATREFFDLVHRRLAPGGVFMLWLGSFGETHARSVAGALSQVFYDLLLVTVDDTAYLVASDAPIVLDVERMARRLGEPGLEPYLAPMGLDRAERLLYAVIGAGRAAPSEVPANTDDNAFVEVALPLVRHLGHRGLAEAPRAVLTEPALAPARFAALGAAHVLELAEWELGSAGGEPTWDDLARLALPRRPTRAAALVEANAGHLPADVGRYLAGRLALSRGRPDAAIEALRAVPSSSAVSLRARRFLAAAHLLRGDRDAAVAIGRDLAALGDPDGAYLYGTLMADDDPEESRRALEQARDRRPRAAVRLARSALERGGLDLEPYRDDLLRALARDAGDPEAHELMAFIEERRGDVLAARRHRALAVDGARARARGLVERATGLSRSGRHRQAAAVLRSALVLDPQPADVWLRLAGAQIADGDPEGAAQTIRQARRFASDPDRLEIGWRRLRASRE